ncbi:hypothetical protein CEE37_01565 [candidate division LCP-89 bacterium B3_LCP]|uniref:Cell division protein FtsX n=1 Tax=candidate division LCP-89 bacterium B3_LCP TaxID=2012998 RepID=A0A532V5B9_UNCL8|nr:MAG: hypothetical protein CEE37_01565 [candidate division LCP-89 bacterium B3_LCP]
MGANLLFVVSEALGGVKRGIFHSFIAIMAITLAITVLGIFFYGLVNLNNAAGNILGNLQAEAFISLVLPDEQHPQLQENVEALDERLLVVYVSRGQAASRFADEFDPDLFNILKDNPLPASFQINLPKELLNPDSAAAVIRKISSVEGIDEVIYDRDLLKLLHSGRKKLTGWGLITGLIAVLLAIGLTFNAARIKISAQSETVQLMSLLGATPRTIRAIFWLQGGMIGIIGGIISIILIASITYLVQLRLTSGIEIVMPYFYLPLVGAVLLGIFGVAIAVGKYLEI